MANEVLQMEARLKNFISGELNKIGNDLGTVEKKTKTTFGSMASAVATGQAALMALQRAWGMVSGYVNDSVKAYGEQVQAEAQLTQALGKTSQALLDQADAIQNTTTFSDDAVVGAQAMVAMFIKEESQIKKMMPAIADFAAAKGMDLKSAADLVTKSIAGEVNALGRYGIKIEGAAGSTERAESAVRALIAAFGGQAVAIANTPTGKIEQQKNLLNNIQETLGEKVVPLQIQWNQLMLDFSSVGVPAASKVLDYYSKYVEIAGKLLGGTSVETIRTEALVKEALAQEDLVRIFNARLEVSKKLLDVESDLAAHNEKWGISSAAGAKERNRLQKEYVELSQQQAILTKGLTTGTAGQNKKTIPTTPGGTTTTAVEGTTDAPFQKWFEENTKAQEKAYNDAVALQEKHQQEVISAQFTFDESRINLKKDEYQREIDSLKLKQEQELLQIADNEQAKTILLQTHKNQELFLLQDIEARKTENARRAAEERIQIHQMEIAATWRSVDASLMAAQTMVEIAGREKDELKPIYIALAVMRAASSTVQAVQSAWESAGGNYYVGAALSAAAVIENVALLAGQIATISSAAKGADFVTNGPQMMLVGDNPSGRERVQVTPAENNRTFNDTGNVSINLNISGNADRSTIDYSIQQLQSFTKQYKRAKYEGMI